ncbi:hypothetical protein FACS1894139_13650 [Planctomycetales bacterium]|nr:hypothetical protein FACS1894107_06610 [Planctomycetales bacterium]GHS98577.1 hypothetical protein FACS1894108_06970 [Planctomycetales bacterium]GHT06848.1 hypothetical protein FACS1894139_13650 [Planctomycetales bacterium]
MNANEQYKDTVFAAYFGTDAARCCEIYNALCNAHATPDAIKINTLDKNFFAKLRNDVSFLVGSELVVLLEHQSTLNENMPLRFLRYIVEQYELLINRKKLYQERLIKLPRPKFFVFYNGKKDCPDKEVLRLSEAFGDNDEAIDLELTVTLLNINDGHNEELLKRCRGLSEYARFVAAARRERATGKPLAEALSAAVDWCVGNDVLRDFLREHRTEVIGMLTAEFDLDEAREVWQEEAREEGERRGELRGRQLGEQRGEQRVRREMILGFRRSGVSDEVISQASGLPLSEIRGYSVDFGR